MSTPEYAPNEAPLLYGVNSKKIADSVSAGDKRQIKEFVRGAWCNDAAESLKYGET
ncbi:Uu.00g012600.m01.CDS01 [Anthostomella pinea]|uniref:Uu.00g012600.m01.CDS01 n=1 Tax=Anthostomella pinea TaxID=933095 RepID=A0AAI8VXZ1_9PEZI|nr:Uu.00g012600.m01.CDS01 [Anthostomella pinea]